MVFYEATYGSVYRGILCSDDWVDLWRYFYVVFLWRYFYEATNGSVSGGVIWTLGMTGCYGYRMRLAIISEDVILEIYFSIGRLAVHSVRPW